MKRLALRIANHKRLEDVYVLGDALREQRKIKREEELPTREKVLEHPGPHDDAVMTGRRRPVRFIATHYGMTLPRIILPDGWPPGRSEHVFQVPAFEVVWNAAHASTGNGSVFVSWATRPRDVYRRLKERGLLPRTVRFSQLKWKRDARENFGYVLQLQHRLSHGHGRPSWRPIFRVYRDYNLERTTRMQTLIEAP